MAEITTAAELADYPPGSVFTDRQGDVWMIDSRYVSTSYSIEPGVMLTSPGTARRDAVIVLRNWGPLTPQWRPDRPAQPTGCECGCGAQPAKAGARFVRGHDPELSIENRLWSGLRITRGGCWEWTRALRGGGYGTISVGSGESKRETPVHRVMWEFAHGTILDGQVVCHACDNRLCCNPAHLFLGTVDDNNQDMVAKGRQVRGESVGTSRITEEVVREIRRRRAAGEAVPSIAADLGLSVSHVYRIASGEVWSHVCSHRTEAEVKAEALEEAAKEFASRLPDGTGNGRAYNSWRVAEILHARAAAIRAGEQ